MLGKILKAFQPQKTRVAVLMGGPSSEHEVSLWSGKMVMKHLDPKKYEAQAIEISKDGKWPMRPKELVENFDVAFIAMHGEYGEDGKVQALLEKYKLPYTGSNSRVSKFAMNKSLVSKLLAKKKITCAPHMTFKKGGLTLNHKQLLAMALPAVVKPTDRGSSVGVNIVRTISELAPAIQDAVAHSNNVMLEKFIKGREVTCAILERDGKAEALPPTEIIPKSKFFDYKAKYTAKTTKEITPPKLPEKTIKNIQRTALKVYKAVKCSSYARIDMILSEDGKLHVLEVNTLPGLTKASLLPQAAKVAGIDFPQLLDIIVNNARR